MKPLCFLLPFALIFPLVAELNKDFTAGMKVVGGANATLAKSETRTGPEAVRAAERMAGVYEEMIGFWRQQGADEAVKLSTNGKAAAVALAAAAHAGDAAKASEAYDAIKSTCKPCHDEFREKVADGSYRLKLPQPEPERKR